jgi:phytoene dehydrogenase-like protein
MLLIRSFSKISPDAYIRRFSHEGIRNLIRSCTYDESGVTPLFFTMGILARSDGGFPEGGSLPFVRRIVETFTSPGGEILYGTRADRVIVENGKAVGVVAGDKRLTADAVIITSDTMAVDKLFDVSPKSAWLDKMRAATKPTMNTFVSLGLDTDLRKYPKTVIFRLEKPIVLATQTYKYISCNNYSRDPVYSPEGKTAMTIMLTGDTYDFWKKAKAENRYEEEKRKLAETVIEALIAHIPEVNGRVDVCDIATPLTYERYCGNWKGSWMTEMTPDMKMTEYPAVIKGLSGVYFAGHRMMPPGGLPAALISGRKAVQHLCRDTDTVFISEE